jgi:hypothetical protein
MAPPSSGRNGWALHRLSIRVAVGKVGIFTEGLRGVPARRPTITENPGRQLHLGRARAWHQQLHRAGRARPGCWRRTPGPDERWPSRLLATAAEDRQNIGQGGHQHQLLAKANLWRSRRLRN